MKKNTIIRLVLLIALAIAAYFGYTYYEHNKVDSENFKLNKEIKPSYKDIGVFDGVLYFRDNNVLTAIDGQSNLLFEKDLDEGILKVIYDKYIYLVYEDGNIQIINRKNGEVKGKKELESEIKFAEIRDKRLICYHDRGVSDLDLNLKNLATSKYEYRPVKYFSKENTSSAIFLDRDVNVLKSRYEIRQDDKESFYISSIDEAFLFNYDLGQNRQILMSSSHIYLIEDNSIKAKKLLVSPKSIAIRNNKIAVVDDSQLYIYDDKLNIIDEVKLGFTGQKVAIFENSIVIIGDKVVSSYEEGNLIKNQVENIMNYYIDDYGVYAIFEDRVERIKAY